MSESDRASFAAYDVEFVVEISRRAPLHRSTSDSHTSSRAGCRALQLYSAPERSTSLQLYLQRSHSTSSTPSLSPNRRCRGMLESLRVCHVRVRVVFLFWSAFSFKGSLFKLVTHCSQEEKISDFCSRFMGNCYPTRPKKGYPSPREPRERFS